MKVKFLLFSTILAAIFLTSAFPSTKNSLRLGEEVEIFKKELLVKNGESFSSTPFIILNFWNPAEPASRINNVMAKRLAATNPEKFSVISICTDKDSSLSQEILKIDGIYSDLSEGSLEINPEIFKVFQVSKGCRHFLLDNQGKLIAISPDFSLLENSGSGINSLL